MTFALYALTFLPMALITLLVHEMGHLVVARLLRVKVSAFQIGIGHTIYTHYTGHTPVPIDHQSLVPGLPHQMPQEGELATVYITENEQGIRRTVAILPLAHHRDQSEAHIATHRQYTNSTMQLTGRVRQISHDQIILADVAWILRAIPLMAGVHFPEDLSLRIPNLLNTASWRTQTLVTLAGPLANLLLFLAIILAMATIPLPQANAQVLSVTQVTPQSPAHSAGFAPGDHIIQVNTTLLPSHPQLESTIAEAAAQNSPLTFQVHRGDANITIKTFPDAATGRLGLNLTTLTPRPTPSQPPNPPSLYTRVAALTDLYIDSFASLLSTDTYADSATPIVMGPITTAYYTAQAVRVAHIKAWLAILAAVTLATALLNLVPIPPLDGYRIVANTIQALRHKPLPPRIEQIIMYGGFGFLIFAGIYLLLYDILLLLT